MLLSVISLDLISLAAIVFHVLELPSCSVSFIYVIAVRGFIHLTSHAKKRDHEYYVINTNIILYQIMRGNSLASYKHLCTLRPSSTRHSPQ